jgi:hypothetical protein
VNCQNISKLEFNIGAGGSGVNYNTTGFYYGNGNNGGDSKIIIRPKDSNGYVVNYTAKGGGGGADGKGNGSDGGSGGGSGAWTRTRPQVGKGQIANAGAKYGYNGGNGHQSSGGNGAAGGGGGPAGVGGDANNSFSLGGLGMQILGSSDFPGSPIMYHSGGGAGGGSNGYYGFSGVGSFGSGNGGYQGYDYFASDGKDASNTFANSSGVLCPCFGGGGGGSGHFNDGNPGGKGAKGCAYLFITQDMVTDVL